MNAGTFHSLALDNSGVAYSAGNKSCGQLGREGTDQTIFEKVDSDKTFIDISCGENVSFFIDSDNKVYSCGNNKLSLQKDNVNKPTLVKALKDIKIKQIDCGLTYAVALSCDGEMYSCGDNTF